MSNIIGGILIIGKPTLGNDALTKWLRLEASSFARSGDICNRSGMRLDRDHWIYSENIENVHVIHDCLLKMLTSLSTSQPHGEDADIGEVSLFLSMTSTSGLIDLQLPSELIHLLHAAGIQLRVSIVSFGMSI